VSFAVMVGSLTIVEDKCTTAKNFCQLRIWRLESVLIGVIHRSICT